MLKTLLTWGVADEKQKKLLAEDTGHFSMIRMLHLADLITELNGTNGPIPTLQSQC